MFETDSNLSAVCPFHSEHGGIALSEIGAIVRLRDRVKFRKAIDQLEKAILQTKELDEAKGEALTFIAVATAATLEIGASRTMHRFQLEAARKLDGARSTTEVASLSKELLSQSVGALIEKSDKPNDRLVDKALSLVDRQYSKPLTDSIVADQLGLSPSHFRFLFRQATGQPFHKYLIGVRRAFTLRFSANPTQVRNASVRN
jgi:AraC-like DNA-binding protein